MCGSREPKELLWQPGNKRLKWLVKTQEIRLLNFRDPFCQFGLILFFSSHLFVVMQYFTFLWHYFIITSKYTHSSLHTFSIYSRNILALWCGLGVSSLFLSCKLYIFFYVLLNDFSALKYTHRHIYVDRNGMDEIMLFVDTFENSNDLSLSLYTLRRYRTDEMKNSGLIWKFSTSISLFLFILRFFRTRRDHLLEFFFAFYFEMQNHKIDNMTFCSPRSYSAEVKKAFR